MAQTSLLQQDSLIFNDNNLTRVELNCGTGDYTGGYLKITSPVGTTRILNNDDSGMYFTMSDSGGTTRVKISLDELSYFRDGITVPNEGEIQVGEQTPLVGLMGAYNHGVWDVREDDDFFLLGDDIPVSDIDKYKCRWNFTTINYDGHTSAYKVKTCPQTTTYKNYRFFVIKDNDVHTTVRYHGYGATVGTGAQDQWGCYLLWYFDNRTSN